MIFKKFSMCRNSVEPRLSPSISARVDRENELVIYIVIHIEMNHLRRSKFDYRASN